MTEEAKHAIGKALGKVPSGVFILTATIGGESTANMVSWVQQAAFAPPALTIALAKDRPVRRMIDSGEAKVALSVLAKGDHGLMKKYARGIPEGQDPFEGVPTGRGPGGAVYLAGALAYLECRVLKACDFGGDHDVYVVEITAGALLKEDEPPFMHTRGNGFHY
jgi:flavin reductase (DIM6/NTAB) family NADH-FMN oxidoreductase RutF